MIDKTIPWHPSELATLNGYSLTYYAKEGVIKEIHLPGEQRISPDLFLAMGGIMPKRVRGRA